MKRSIERRGRLGGDVAGRDAGSAGDEHGIDLRARAPHADPADRANFVARPRRRRRDDRRLPRSRLLSTVPPTSAVAARPRVAHGDDGTPDRAWTGAPDARASPSLSGAGPRRRSPPWRHAAQFAARSTTDPDYARRSAPPMAPPLPGAARPGLRSRLPAPGSRHPAAPRGARDPQLRERQTPRARRSRAIGPRCVSGERACEPFDDIDFMDGMTARASVARPGARVGSFARAGSRCRPAGPAAGEQAPPVPRQRSSRSHSLRSAPHARPGAYRRTDHEEPPVEPDPSAPAAAGPSPGPSNHVSECLRRRVRSAPSQPLLSPGRKGAHEARNGRFRGAAKRTRDGHDRRRRRSGVDVRVVLHPARAPCRRACRPSPRMHAEPFPSRATERRGARHRAAPRITPLLERVGSRGSR